MDDKNREYVASMLEKFLNDADIKKGDILKLDIMEFRNNKIPYRFVYNHQV